MKVLDKWRKRKQQIEEQELEKCKEIEQQEIERYKDLKSKLEGITTDIRTSFYIPSTFPKYILQKWDAKFGDFVITHNKKVTVYKDIIGTFLDVLDKILDLKHSAPIMCTPSDILIRCKLMLDWDNIDCNIVVVNAPIMCKDSSFVKYYFEDDTFTTENIGTNTETINVPKEAKKIDIVLYAIDLYNATHDNLGGEYLTNKVRYKNLWIPILRSEYYKEVASMEELVTNKLQFSKGTEL